MANVSCVQLTNEHMMAELQLLTWTSNVPGRSSSWWLHQRTPLLRTPFTSGSTWRGKRTGFRSQPPRPRCQGRRGLATTYHPWSSINPKGKTPFIFPQKIILGLVDIWGECCSGLHSANAIIIWRTLVPNFSPMSVVNPCYPPPRCAFCRCLLSLLTSSHPYQTLWW